MEKRMSLGIPLNHSMLLRCTKIEFEIKRFTGDTSHCASDDMPWSPKTNSASPAGCGIASLASQGQIIPSPDHALRREGLWKPSFLEGTVLNQRTDGIAR